VGNAGGQGQGLLRSGGACLRAAIRRIAPQLCSVAGQCIDAGTCLEDGDCKAAATVCDPATSTCVPGGGCAETEAKVAAVPPNLLLVLDRSCSMTQPAGPGATKWQAAVAAINTLTTTYNGKIRFGLSMFPDTVTPAAPRRHAFPPARERGGIQLTSPAPRERRCELPRRALVTEHRHIDGVSGGSAELADTASGQLRRAHHDGKQAGCNPPEEARTLTIIGDLFTVGADVRSASGRRGPGAMDAPAVAGGA
jgi:hypothetical protein